MANPNVGGGTQTMGGESRTNDLGHRASETANQMKDKAAELGRNAVGSLDRGIDSAADALHSTASSLRSKAPAGGRVGTMANRAADTIEGAASYMREHDVRDMVGDLEGVVRRNPGPSLLIAAAFGFLLGSAIRGGGSSDRMSRY